MNLPLAFVDLETTGATAADDRITEIGIVEIGANGVSEWSTLVNPQVPISAFIERLTGISDALVATAPTFAAIADEVRSRLDGRLFIAHNARFDYGFLKNEFKRLGIDFRATVLCTVKLSRKLEPQHQRHNLDALMARHGLVADGRHRALADARLIQQLWEKLRRQFPAETFDALVLELTARPSLPPQVAEADFDGLPDGHGVYVFRGENDLPLYVNRSKRVRSSVLAHFSAARPSAREATLTAQVRRIEALPTGGEIGSQLLEAALVGRLRPLHQRRPQDVDELLTWRLDDRGDGRWQPTLLAASEVDFGAEEAVYGLFANRREASRTLQQLARDHHLCLATLGCEPTTADEPCSAYRAGHCRGVCIGRELPSMHSARLMAGLARLRLLRWPFAGAAGLREGEAIHLIDRWAHLGTATSETELWSLLENPQRHFDRNIYRILVKLLGQMTPLPPQQRLEASRLRRHD